MIKIAHPIIGREEEQAVLDVLRSGVIIQGKKLKNLKINSQNTATQNML
jgi:dTDP-4-amino-4,6-dideoxygalactose transaminase